MAQEIARTYPEVADATRLDRAGRAWMAGYLTHITTDVAYWRHILTRLPPFPEHADIHLGAWLLADALTASASAPVVDINSVRYEFAPSWIEAEAVRRLMMRVTEKLLTEPSMWPLEVAYYRGRTAPTELSDEAIRRRSSPVGRLGWRKPRSCCLRLCGRHLGTPAIAGAVDVVLAYLEPSRVVAGRDR